MAAKKATKKTTKKTATRSTKKATARTAPVRSTSSILNPDGTVLDEYKDVFLPSKGVVSGVDTTKES